MPTTGRSTRSHLLAVTVGPFLLLLLAACTDHKEVATDTGEQAANEETGPAYNNDTAKPPNDTAPPPDPADMDGDGVANPEHGGDDCDDSDPETYPGAREQWYDGIDQNCDGLGDDDQDGDGYLAIEVGGDDCDDRRDSAYPGAPEVCDPYDHDCDGEPLEAGVCATPPTVAQSASHSWAGGYGDAFWPDSAGLVRPAGDLDGDGVGEAIIMAEWGAALYEHNDPEGLDWIGGAVAVVQPNGAALGGWVGDEVVFKRKIDTESSRLEDVGSAGDFNGDGWPDVFWVSYGGTSTYGKVGMMLGPRTEESWPSDETFLHEGASAFWNQAYAEDGFGIDVLASDLDQDGFTDLVVGTKMESPHLDAGFFLIQGRRLAGQEHEVWDETFIVGRDDETGETCLGSNIDDVGDLDGDGFSEVGVFCTLSTTQFRIASGVELLESDGSHLRDLTKWWMTGEESDRQCCQTHALEAAGDWNGDGHAEVAAIIKSDPTGHYEENHILVLQPQDEGMLSYTTDVVSDWYSDPIVSDGDGYNTEPAELASGDFDGDGTADLGFGVKGRLGSVKDEYAYEYSLHILPSSLGVGHGEPFWETSFRVDLAGDELGDRANCLMAGDLESDGFDDLFFCTTGPTMEGYSSAGQAWILPGWDIPWDDPDYW